jgi:hypothetical protein
VRAFPGVLPAFYAKEFCSCRYVMGQTDAYCRGYATQWLPISSFAHDEAAKRVTVRATGVTRSARCWGGGKAAGWSDLGAWPAVTRLSS